MKLLGRNNDVIVTPETNQKFYELKMVLNTNGVNLKPIFSLEISTVIKTKVLYIENDRATDFTHADLMFSFCR